MAEKGRIGVIKDGTGGIVMDKNGNSLEFSQPYLAELNLNQGDIVRFDRASIGGKEVANNVVRSTVGVISSINPDNQTGYITEKEPNKLTVETVKPKLIPFFQPNIKELGIAVGDMVHYSLILTRDGQTMAVNVEEN